MKFFFTLSIFIAIASLVSLFLQEPGSMQFFLCLTALICAVLVGVGSAIYVIKKGKTL